MDIRKPNTETAERGWPPSLDLHAEGDELVLHVESRGSWEGLEVSLEGGELVMQSADERGLPACSSHLPLPFSLQDMPAMCRPSAEILEFHIPIPERLKR